MKQYDLPGIHDYRCWASLSGTGCALSVFDRKEAEDMCDTDPECHGFVMTEETTWTGITPCFLFHFVQFPLFKL